MFSKEPIIVVDDDLDDHFIFREIAERIRLTNEIIFFRNGFEFINYLKTTTDNPFIIFCDINMPTMGGLETRKRIIEDDYLRKKSIPFVFFTTAASKVQVSEAYELTVQGFFIKQPSFDETERTFKLILDYWDRCKHPNSYK